MSSLETALLEITAFLDHEKTPYMVIGGMANMLWGQPRSTLDIDITLWAESQQVESLANSLRNAFTILVDDPATFIAETRVLPIASKGGVRIDLIFGLLAFEEQAIQRARIIDIQGKPVHFCTPEDLILHKIISSRDQDLQDVKHIIISRSKSLELDYLEPRIRELAHELEKPEIWQRWAEWKNNYIT